MYNDIKKIDGCVRKYEYEDFNGNKGEMQYCYKDKKGLVCKDIKHSFRVKSAKEKRVCE
jgi:hypothetical protein